MTQMYDPHEEWDAHPVACVCKECKDNALSDLVKLIHKGFDKSLQNMTDRAYELEREDLGPNTDQSDPSFL